MKKYDYVIVGGGASGSALAIMLARKNFAVAVIDKNTFPAKKLLVTGNGKCNITNKNLSSEFYNQNIDEFLTKFNFEQVKSFFSSIGIEIFSDDMGRCYPLSGSAKSVVNAVKNQFDLLNIDFYSENEFLDAEKINDTFEVKTDKEIFLAKKLVIACGGNNITELLDKHNIEYKKFVPSLVALKTKENTKNLDGQRIANVLVKTICDGEIKQEYGEVLFKNQGLSGICIFNLSTVFARKNNFSGKVIIDLLPNYQVEEIEKILKKQVEIYKDFGSVLNTFVSEKISSDILKRVKFAKNSEKNQENIEKIAKILKNYEFNINGCYDNNQVFSGGIMLKDLTKNLEYKKIKNLYFCGEVCDVDAICGGYNLQWAWSSAYIIASEFDKKI